MYIFKTQIFNRLLLNKYVNGMRIGELAGIPTRTILNWTNDYARIPVWGVVAICNAARISISSLIENEDNGKDNYLHYSYFVEAIPEDKFEPLVYDNEAIGNIYKENGWANITKKEFRNKLGVYEGTVNNWILKEKALRLATLIDICNTFNLHINNFIKDPNRRAVPPQKENSANELAIIHEMQAEMKKIQHDSLQKSKLIASLQKEVDTLKEENEVLNLFSKTREMTGNPPLATIAAEDAVPYQRIAGKATKPRYVFNKYLFKSLPQLSGISIDAISSLCKISPIYIDEGSDEFRFSQLISLCNKLHISIRHFFLREGELYVIGRPDEYFSDANAFKRITYCSENMASLAGVGGVLGLSRTFFCDAIGITPGAFTQWIKTEKQSSLSVNGLLRICNAYHISPDMFFDDPNSEIPRSYPVSAEDILFTENLLLKKHVKEQQKKIGALQKEDSL